MACPKVIVSNQKEEFISIQGIKTAPSTDFSQHSSYHKICVKLPIKIDKSKVLKRCGSLMGSKVFQNAPLSILQHFHHALSDN